MGRKKGRGLTAVSEILPGLEPLKPVLAEQKQALSVTPQGKHHYNRYHQIEALQEIGDDPNPDMGFMTRLLTLCSLPRTNPGDRAQYKRQNGPYRLYMQAGPETKLPYGNIPRLLLAWVCTEAVKTKNRDLILGPSLLSFMHELGMSSNSGGERGDRTRLRNQMERLFNAHIHLIYEVPGHKVTTSSAVADRMELWWDYRTPEQDTIWHSQIRLGEAFFNEIVANPVPLDMRILKAMRRSSLGLDLYMWMSYKTYSLYSQRKKPERLTWERLYRQFSADPDNADRPFGLADRLVVNDFRKDALRELRKLKLCWPTLEFATPKGCLEIRPCPPSISPNALAGR